jgi:flagellar biosynthesis/type III secretory pathway M-ring protein FliF/YscJ
LSEYAELKRYHEREYQQTIARALAYIPGVLVTTSVELLAPPAVAPPSEDSPAAARATAPKRVAVSITIPSSYYEKIWRQSHPRVGTKPPAKPQAADLAQLQLAERRKIEQLVAPLLPQAEAGGAASVSVSTFEQSADRMAENNRWTHALAWAQRNERSLGIGALGLVGLVAVWSLVRWLVASPAEPPVAALGADLMADEPRDAIPQPSAREQLIRRFDAGTSLSEELADAVREDPRAAVSILRNWIGQAG